MSLFYHLCFRLGGGYAPVAGLRLPAAAAAPLQSRAPRGRSARGVFPGQGSHLCLLRWRVDFFFFLTPEHQGSPICHFLSLILNENGIKEYYFFLKDMKTRMAYINI